LNAQLCVQRMGDSACVFLLRCYSCLTADAAGCRDAAPEAVALLLQAIYGQEVAVPLQHLVQLTHLADQYQTTDLMDAIIKAADDKPIVAQALAQLLPAAVAAGGTDRLVECLLEQVVAQITAISQAPDLFQQWSPQVVQLVIKAAGGRAVYEALQVKHLGLSCMISGSCLLWCTPRPQLLLLRQVTSSQLLVRSNRQIVLALGCPAWDRLHRS
jgi:hypothetical protein